MATAVAAASCWLGASSAFADTYPIDGGPDTGDHSFCFDPAHPMASAVRDRAFWTMDNNEGVEAQTVVNTLYKEACGPHTDVRFQQRALPFGWGGYSPCTARAADGTTCDRRDVQIDWAQIKAAATNDNFEARHTLCHEVGHTLGAEHYENELDNPDGIVIGPHSCMRSGVWDSGALWTRSYGNHHRTRINLRFRED